MNASRTSLRAAVWINEAGLAAVLALSTPPVVLASVPHAAMTARAQEATSDSRIEAQVNAALEADTTLRGSSVSVQSVHDGSVVLAGTARSMSDHLRATGDAARVPGVHRVVNDVKIRDLLSDPAGGERRPPEAGRSYGTSVRDTWSASATEARVLADSPTPGLRLVNVDTRNGAVRLLGAAPPARVEAAAKERARKMSRVRSARDQDLQREVRRALQERPELTDASIDVDVKRGVARLTGTVPTHGQRRAAALTARSVEGVRSVRDALRVSSR